MLLLVTSDGIFDRGEGLGLSSVARHVKEGIIQGSSLDTITQGIISDTGGYNRADNAMVVLAEVKPNQSLIAAVFDGLGNDYGRKRDRENFGEAGLPRAVDVAHGLFKQQVMDLIKNTPDVGIKQAGLQTTQPDGPAVI